MPTTARKIASSAPAPSTRAAASAATTNAEKARALIAMLEAKSGSTPAVAPDRLRDWARDLVETVEKSRKEPSSPPRPAAKAKLFSTAPPRLEAVTKEPPTARPSTSSASAHKAQAAEPEILPRAAPPSSRMRAAPKGRMTLTAPRQQDPVAAASQTPVESAEIAPSEIRKLVQATVDPATMTREHPAIIAMTLVGKPSIEQAGALRSLPGGQVRAVHRALRTLEARVT